MSASGCRASENFAVSNENQFFPIYFDSFCDAGQVPIFRYYEACDVCPTCSCVSCVFSIYVLTCSFVDQSDDKTLRIWRTRDWQQEAIVTEPFKEV